MQYTSAFVLINCEPEKSKHVEEKIKKDPAIEYAQSVHGAYDIIAKIQDIPDRDVKDTITWKIKKLDNVRSTLSLQISD